MTANVADRRARSALALLVAGVALGVGGPALGAEPKTILIESYADARPIGMSRYMNEIASALNLPGLLAGDELRARLEATFARPAGKATPEDLQALVKRASEGTSSYGDANFTVAITQLSQVVDGLARESAALVSDRKLSAVRKEALLTLAQAYVKQHRIEDAKATLRELLRSYPEVQDFPAATYPPKIVDLGKAVLKERAESSATLLVDSVPSGRKVYVNEQLVGETPRTLTKLLPGSYRVYLPPGGASHRGSVRVVDLRGRATTLTIETEIDDHLETEEYVGLRFGSAAERERFETPVACAIARKLGASEVIILTRQRSPAAETEILGAIYDAANAHRKWGAILPLAPSPPNDAALAKFALSLRTRRQVEGVRVAPAEARSASGAPRAVAAEPLQVRRSDDRGFRLGRGTQIALGTSLGLAAALTAAGLASFFAFDCSGDAASGPCGAGTGGRSATTSLMGLALGGYSVGLGLLVGVVVDYALHRARLKPRIALGAGGSVTASVGADF